jgi:hypothetical protein
MTLDYDALRQLPWWRRLLCRLHICSEVFDGRGWDGGYHCRSCLRNWAWSWKHD